jgi:hypothetical protein
LTSTDGKTRRDRIKNEMFREAGYHSLLKQREEK